MFHLTYMVSLILTGSSFLTYRLQWAGINAAGSHQLSPAFEHTMKKDTHIRSFHASGFERWMPLKDNHLYLLLDTQVTQRHLGMVPPLETDWTNGNATSDSILVITKCPSTSCQVSAAANLLTSSPSVPSALSDLSLSLCCSLFHYSGEGSPLGFRTRNPYRFIY